MKLAHSSLTTVLLAIATEPQLKQLFFSSDLEENSSHPAIATTSGSSLNNPVGLALVAERGAIVGAVMPIDPNEGERIMKPGG